VEIPVQIAVDPNVTLSSATYTVQYDPTKLDFVSVTGASVFSGWGVTAGADAGTITILMSDAVGHTTGASVENLQLATITFNVLETFIGGTSALNVAPVNPNEGGLVWSNDNVDDGSVKFALLGDYNQNGVVDAADYSLWRKTVGTSVPNYTGADGNGDGIINSDDYTVWRNNFGISAMMGPGAGAIAISSVPVSYDAPVPEQLISTTVASIDSSTQSTKTYGALSTNVSDASSALVERHVTRDAAIIELVDSMRSKTSIRQATEFSGSSGALIADSSELRSRDLLFDLVAKDKPMSHHATEAIRHGNWHNEDVADALDQLFSELDLDGESVKVAFSA